MSLKFIIWLGSLIFISSVFTPPDSGQQDSKLVFHDLMISAPEWSVDSHYLYFKVDYRDWYRYEVSSSTLEPIKYRYLYHYPTKEEAEQYNFALDYIPDSPTDLLTTVLQTPDEKYLVYTTD